MPLSFPSGVALSVIPDVGGGCGVVGGWGGGRLLLTYYNITSITNLLSVFNSHPLRFAKHLQCCSSQKS